MLDTNQVDAAITSFIARKQKQFPDINLSRDRQTLALIRALRNRSGRVDKDLRPLRHNIELA